MANHSWLLFLAMFLFMTILSTSYGGLEPERKVHIVYMGELPNAEFSTESYHYGILQQALGSAASESLVYSYKRSFNAFAAKLSEEEVKKIANMDGVVSVFPNKVNKLHTTRSWDFMGFTETVSRRKGVESDVIIGMIDTGIWPESASFDDAGFGPPPSKWKGSCQSSANFSCNNKIIGARYYYTGEEILEGESISPRDSAGHGTHTASTAAGNHVSRTSLEGFAQGTVRGAVPSARLAVYKVCWGGCSDANILAAFDDAIADGVDIISISIGGFTPLEYFNDVISIGSFHAMKKGILTSNSAGNSGPDPATLVNFSPWSLIVAASTIDRRFVTKVVLGNGKVYEGVSINTFKTENRMLPLVYGGNVPNVTAGFNGSVSRYCRWGTLDKTLVKGKIVFCDKFNLAGPIFAGAMGIVMQDVYPSDSADTFPLPASYFEMSNDSEILIYINTTRNPTANILRSNEIVDTLAPVVVSFSSRGPHPLKSNILKPDISAPGVDILAAWSPDSSMSGYPGDKRVVSYNIISGTSMSCPHVTGAAAYVKSFHPTWSPSAVKSALMTTAYPMKASMNADAEFAYGAGHINPVQAVDPGLVYDADERDFVEMLCNEGYNTTLLRLVTGDNSSCSNSKGSALDLNYPSMAITVLKGKPFNASFSRTVTNVGIPISVYTPTLIIPSSLTIRVQPQVLKFNSIGEKQSFVVSVEGKTNENISSAALVWSDGVHQVRSPIVVQSF